VISNASAVLFSALQPGSGAIRHAVVSTSIVASGTVIAEAEVSHALVGPFVGLHHHSLLIAAMWPQGKGNIAYGANVGSNHTGKLPDQEILPGEGVFFGLGVSIKFPSNFEESPYSLIASGVITLPQRVCMPFALINQQGSGVLAIPGFTPAINEIIPAWMLSANIYAVYRNQQKFRERAAVLADSLLATPMPGSCPADIPEWNILNRVDIVCQLQRALTDLRAAKAPMHSLGGKPVDSGSAWPGTAVFVEKQVAGIGKNYMTEHSRQSAMKTYDRYIRMYALCCLFTAVTEHEVWNSSKTRGWSYCIQEHGWNTAREQEILPAAVIHRTADKGFIDIADVRCKAFWAPMLLQYISMLQEDAAMAADSKLRDTERGRLIIPDYDLVHGTPESDPTLQLLKKVIAAAESARMSWASASKDCTS
jgi:hypothetical protein